MTEDRFARTVGELGGTLYLVGGCVRDEMLGRMPKDRDYVVCGVSKDSFEGCFDAVRTGNRFPVYKLTVAGAEVEVALARTERKVKAGYNGFEAFTSPEITIEQDLARRDLTVNAMAKRLPDGQITDPFGGADDLRRGVIRAVSDSFADDPLRLVRAIRFSVQLNFDIESHTYELMRLAARELNTLSPDRLKKELDKMSEEERERFRLFYKHFYTTKRR